MKVFGIVLSVLIVVIVVLSIVIHIKSKKIERIEAQNNEYKTAIERINAEVEALKKDINRGNQAAKIYKDLSNDAAQNYKDNIQIIVENPVLSDWLDQPLPDGLYQNDKVCRGANDQSSVIPY